jgi:hypothetical protein
MKNINEYTLRMIRTIDLGVPFASVSDMMGCTKRAPSTITLNREQQNIVNDVKFADSGGVDA